MARTPSSIRAMYASLALCDVAAECFGLREEERRGLEGEGRSSKIVGTGWAPQRLAARTEGDTHRAVAGGSGVAFHSGAPPSALRDCRDALSRANAAFLSSIMARGGGRVPLL